MKQTIVHTRTTFRPTRLKFNTPKILSTCRAETFEPDLLAVNDKTLIRAFCHWQRYSRQAVSVAAARTCEMRMALMLGTVVRQFKMPGPLVHIGLVHQPNA